MRFRSIVGRSIRYARRSLANCVKTLIGHKAFYLLVGTIRYTQSSLANNARILTGRKIFLDDADLIFRQYVLQLIGVRPIKALTCTGLPREGAGSQALSLMHAINLARSSGVTYVHTPFSAVYHADRPRQEWADAWETLFNLGAGEKLCDVPRHEVVNFCYGFDTLPLLLGWQNRREELATRFKAIVPEFRRKYYLDKVPRVSQEVTVAVHVRRGDVSANDDLYFTSIDIVARAVSGVKAILETHNIAYRIAVYSQGNPADFAQLSLLGAELFIDADAIWTMQELIEADILVMAKGFFSYYAGLISDGIRIFEPCVGFEPMDDWIVRSPDGSFDRADFDHQLLTLAP